MILFFRIKLLITTLNKTDGIHDIKSCYLLFKFKFKKKNV